jgi:hypothetical protein
MARTPAIIDQAMRKEGFVSASVVCTQYGFQRAVLLDAVLQGKIAPQKPDSSAQFYVKWEDCLKFFGTPKEFRAKPKQMQEEILTDEILLDGMIPVGELEDLYREEANKKSAQKREAVQASSGAPRRVIVKPSDYARAPKPEEEI